MTNNAFFVGNLQKSFHVKETISQRPQLRLYLQSFLLGKQHPRVVSNISFHFFNISV